MKEVKKNKEEEIKNVVVVENFMGFIEKNKFLGVLKLAYDETKEPLVFYLPIAFIPTAVAISRIPIWENMKGAVIRVKMFENKLVAIGHPTEEVWITDTDIKDFYDKVEKQIKANAVEEKVEKEVKTNDGKDSKGNGGEGIPESSSESNNKTDSKKEKTTSGKQKGQ